MINSNTAAATYRNTNVLHGAPSTPGAAGKPHTGTTALGTSETVSKHDGQDAAKESLKRRGLLWELQRVMWRITEDKTLAGCHRWNAGGAAATSLVWQGNGKARWGGLQNSHSVWGSPVAAVAISARRAAEVSGAVETWGKAGKDHAVTLGTFTVGHKASHSLKDVRAVIAACWNAVTGNASWTGGGRSVGDRETYGARHWTRFIEVTHGRNGWHVHVHALFFHDRTLSADELESFKGRMFDRWKNRAENKGFTASEERAVDLVHLRAGGNAAGAMANYCAKGMITGLAAEVATGQIAKVAKNGNRVPFAILADIDAGWKAGDDVSADVKLWREWESGSKRMQFQRWSKGAKDALEVNVLAEDQIDESMVDTDEAETVAQIDREVWRDLASDVETRLRILDAVAPAKDADEARRFARLILSDLGVPHRLLSIPMADRGGQGLPTHHEALARDLHRHVLGD